MNFSLKKFWANLGPYRELAGYLKPYRNVLILGSLCGLGFGVVSGSIPFIINFVGQVVFSTDPGGGANKANLGAMAKPLEHLAVSVFHVDELSKGMIVAMACLLIPLVMLVRSALDFLNGYCSEWTSQKVLIDIRAKLMEQITSQSLDFFNEAHAGNLFQRVVNETREVRNVLTIINTQLIAQPATLISGMIVLFRLDWRFTLGALILLPGCVGPAIYLGKKIRMIARNEEGEGREMMVILHELIGGIKVIKSFSRTQHEVARFNASSREQFHQQMRVKRLMECTAPVIESLAAMGIALGLYYVYSVGMEGSTFIALCVGVFLLYQPLKTLSKTHLILTRAHIVVKSVFEMIHREPSVADAPDAKRLENCQGEITFQDVNFSYSEGIPALQDFDFPFEKGKYYALVGESGAGKSTLLSLIMRFYDPNTGCVRMDGQDLRNLTQDSLRENIGIVTQDTFLFHDTIHKNILYGRLDATEEEVIQAARLAHAHDFIMDQKNGYDTVIGDKGCMLSGGQQQRLSIARAVLKNAPVLLLDEATSALDSTSEQQIQAALETLTKGRTVIAIAHRLSTILKADCILVLERGRLMEVGSHQELIQRSGIYRKLYELQFHVSA
ncbi:MAG: ABC transporter ATP-binding protein [Terrimicrobiaceae bacterium]